VEILASSDTEKKGGVEVAHVVDTAETPETVMGGGYRASLLGGGYREDAIEDVGVDAYFRPQRRMCDQK
jgi:hypothetical protein